MSNDLKIRLRQPQMLRIALQPGNFLVTPEISIGTVTTLPPNQPASVVVTGTVKQPVLNFGIPKGDPGDATIDDTAGSGATTKVWSADKAYGEIETAKAALENDVGDLKSALNEFEDIELLTVNTTWERGGLDNTGKESLATTRGRSGFITVKKGEVLTVKHGSYYWMYHKYGLDGTYIGQSSYSGTWSQVDRDIADETGDYQYRLVIRNPVNTSDVIVSDIDVVLKKTTAYYDKMQEIDRQGLEIDALRENTDERIEAITSIKDVTVDCGWQLGSINGQGQDAVASNRARSTYIPLAKGETLTVTPNTMYAQWHRYSASGEYEGMSSFSGAWTNNVFSLKNDDADKMYRIVLRGVPASADVVIADIDTTVSIKTILNSTLESVKGIVDDYDFEIVVPSRFEACGGIELNIYHQNILLGISRESIFDMRGTVHLEEFDRFSRLSPAASASAKNQGFKFQVWPLSHKRSVSSKTIQYDVVPSTAGNGLTKKVLLIGDSITYNYNAISKHLVNMFADNPMSIDLLGTMGTGDYKHEGRPGWSAYDYAFGDSSEGSPYTNPFWNPTSQSFDFAYYMQNNEYNSVDYVFLNLGTNDTGNPENYGIAMTEIIQKIHSYDANIRIGVWLCPPRAYIGNGHLVESMIPITLCKKAIAMFDNMQSSRVYLVPVYFNVDPYYDFPSNVVNVSARNSDYTMRVGTDKVHPSTAGYNKIGDVIYSYIKYFGSLDVA